MVHLMRTFMGNRTYSALVAALALAFVALSADSIALAADPQGTSMTVSAPASATMGDPVRLEATLQTGSGQPVSKALVTFYTPVTFLGGASELVRVGDAVTDARGIAVFEYVARQGGENAVRARYAGDEAYLPSHADTRFAMEGNHTLYEPEAGIRVPFFSKWILVGILGTIWSIYLFVGVQVLMVALAPPDRPSPRF